MAGLRFTSNGRAVYPAPDYNWHQNAHTVIQLVDRNAAGAFHSILSIETNASPASGSGRFGVLFKSDNLLVADNGGSGTDSGGSGAWTFGSSDGVYFQGYRFPGGNSPAQFFRAVFTGGAWGSLSYKDGNGSLNSAVSLAAGSDGVIVIGEYDGGDDLNGDVYLQAVIDEELSQADINAIFAAKTTEAILAHDVGFAADAEDGLAADISGNGRDRSALSGTSSIAVPTGLGWLFGPTSASPPENTVAPAVTGTAAIGETLTCSTGTWAASPTPTYAYQWQHETGGDWVEIDGETDSTYVVGPDSFGLLVRCEVTATNSEGSASANSNTTGPVAAAPPLDFSVRLTGGASNTDPALSLGGAESSTEYVGFEGSGGLFGNLEYDDYQPGVVDYRCVTIHNDDDVSATIIAFISQQLETDRAIAIAVADEAAGVTVETIVDATTAPSGPTFSSPTTVETGIDMGTIDPGEFRGLWIRRTVGAALSPDASNPWEISYQVTPA